MDRKDLIIGVLACALCGLGAWTAGDAVRQIQAERIEFLSEAFRSHLITHGKSPRVRPQVDDLLSKLGLAPAEWPTQEDPTETLSATPQEVQE